jgi:glycosyltransferase involved in cell wall biosynthesis
MRVSGFTFVRNAIRFDYPVVESISSALPLVDEFIVNVGDCSDDTLRLIESIGSPKIKTVRSRWDPGVRSGGRMLAIQADLALSQCTGDWALYIQADEVLHEEDIPKIHAALSRHMDDNRIEGLLFEFVHFYANYHTVGIGRKWYGHEIRALRCGLGIRAWKDAQGFRLGGNKLRVAKCGAKVYHYGWVKDPARMKAKTVELAKWWHDDRTVETKYKRGAREFIFNTGGRLALFRGSHPSVMADRIAASVSCGPEPPVERGPISLKHRLLDWMDERFGWHPGQYRNYSLLPEGSGVAPKPQDREKDDL